MIKTEDIKKIMKLTLLTGDIKNIKPNSLLIVGKSGNGKTEILAGYDKKKALYITDMSAHGLLTELQKDPQINHIIIPDFIKLTQKARSTSDNLVSMLNALIEEGGTTIALKNFKAELHDRRIGLITATTKGSYSQHIAQWKTIGFVQRMLIVSFDYKDETIEEIFNFINNELFINDKKEKLKDKKRLIEIKSCGSLNKQLNKYSNRSFRSLKNLQNLAKANAFNEGRKEVTQKDIDEIIRLTKYMNLNYTKI